MTNSLVENRQWWVQRWLELLDSYRFKKRLERARNYAREGHILSLEVENAQVIAQVQGSEVEPYRVCIELEPFSDEDWLYVTATLADKALYSAQLLAGQMPESIEQVFIKNGLSLFPYTLNDIRSHCTCPDQANPCKHIGAIYYQLGDRLSDDPFIMLQLRGRSKTQLIQALRQQRNSDLNRDKQKVSASLTVLDIPESGVEYLPSKVEKTATKPDILAQIQAFWQYDQPIEPSLVVIAPPNTPQTILDILGPLPLPLEEAEEAKQLLQQIYQTASQKAIANGMQLASEP